MNCFYHYILSEEIVEAETMFNGVAVCFEHLEGKHEGSVTDIRRLEGQARREIMQKSREGRGRPEGRGNPNG